MKKTLCMVIAIIMVATLTVSAFAATNPGSIIINNANADTTYSIYRLLDLSYETGKDAYAYTINSVWEEFFRSGAGAAYVTIDSLGYVTWTASKDETTMITFTQEALAYAKTKPIDPTMSSTTSSDYSLTGTVGKFENLPLGWYLVDSTAGALCSLTTTNYEGHVNAKNKTPTVEKNVKEDLGGTWGPTNSADIGQTVEFRVTIHAAAGVENYALHDKLSNGLTFEHDSANNKGVTKIYYVPGSTGVETDLVEGVDYNVVAATCDLCVAEKGESCTFHVEFTEKFLKELKPNDRIYIFYNAVLNANAVIGADGDGNTNNAYLEYGEAHFTVSSETKTYTFFLDLVKTDSYNKLLSGATFKIYDAETLGNEIKVKLVKNSLGEPVLTAEGYRQYIRYTGPEAGDTIEVENGVVYLYGFDNGTYYLEELQPPTGYNKLANRHAFTISDANLDAIITDGIYSTGSGVQVINKTGNMLPETGGMGTFLFITFGTLVVLGTGVLLVTKKRMSMIED